MHLLVVLTHFTTLLHYITLHMVMLFEYDLKENTAIYIHMEGRLHSLGISTLEIEQQNRFYSVQLKYLELYLAIRKATTDL